MIFLLIGNFSSCSMVLGYAASLLAVENASRNGSRTRLTSRKLWRPKITTPTPIRMHHRMASPK
jgi:hypothetical protein